MTSRNISETDSGPKRGSIQIKLYTELRKLECQASYVISAVILLLEWLTTCKPEFGREGNIPNLPQASGHRLREKANNIMQPKDGLSESWNNVERNEVKDGREDTPQILRGYRHVRATALSRNVPLHKAFLAPLDSSLSFILVRRFGPSLVIIISPFLIHTDKAPELYPILLPPASV